MNNIKGICIISKDIQRLRSFYSSILQAEFEGDSNFSTIHSGGVQLSLCDEKIMEQMAPGSLIGRAQGRFTIEIQVDDVDVEYQRLLKIRASVIKPPTTQPWGLRSVWFCDPDENIVNLFTNIANNIATDK